MIKFEKNGTIKLELETTVTAEEYCSKKNALTNLIIASIGTADHNTLIECLDLSRAMELDVSQIQKIIDSK